MRVFRRKTAHVDEAIQWSEFNTYEIEEIALGYGMLVRQYGDALQIGSSEITTGGWVVIEGSKLTVYQKDEFEEKFEEIEI